MSIQKNQDERAEFYSSRAVAKHILLNGVPRSGHAFRAMVASGSALDLTSAKGLSLIANLGAVTFMRHPQQINILDRSNGKIIASIIR